jgi:hypothetical protein
MYDLILFFLSILKMSSIYGQRMKTYIDALPTTNINIIYFSSSTFVKEEFHSIHVNRKMYYVNCGERGEWIYTYLPTALKYIFIRNDTEVKAFIGKIEYADPYHSGGTFNMGIIGSHLTVGLIQRVKIHFITTHFTEYEETDTFAFEADRSKECTIILEDAVSNNTKCYTRKGGATSLNLGDAYVDNQHWIPVIELYQSVFMNIPVGGTIQKGLRGGAYIMVNGKRKYIRKPSICGGGRKLEDGVIGMLHTYVIKPVIKAYFDKAKEIVDASMLYDQDNIFESSNPMLVLIYDIPDHAIRKLFYLETDKMFAAYDAFNKNNNTKFATTCWEEVQQMAETHIAQLVHL